MATLDLNILTAANDDRLFAASLTDRSRLYLQQSVITASAIIELATLPDGISNAQLAHRLKLHPNTVKQYCRWLVEVKLLEESIERIGRHNYKIYRKTKQSQWT